jgi:K+-sensing histidine kinase KdpD
LFICAQIVKAHGGGIDVLSSAEAGTRFSATLPTGVVETDDATRRSPTARGAEPSSGMSA